jgi:hypothetical protein
MRDWQDFEAFARRARKLCPWAEPEPERPITQSRRYRSPRRTSSTGLLHSPALGQEAAATATCSGLRSFTTPPWSSDTCL